MRLINTHTYELEEFNESEKPSYAILSHTWEKGEVEFAHLPLSQTSRPGRKKIVAFCSKARSKGFQWGWVDTCCINKANSTELSEAINSMFLWYKEAGMCFAYLCDLDVRHEIHRGCRWFSRGWTLQELIAPRKLHFYDRNWDLVGSKARLISELSHITRIDRHVLAGADPTTCSIAQRMSWAAGRKTERIEDRAYSLFGLFEMTIPMQYGDRQRAFMLLQEEIIKKSDDETIFAWGQFFPSTSPGPCGLLATSPDAFATCQEIIRSKRHSRNTSGFTMTNVGLSIELRTYPYAMNTYLCLLQACYQEEPRLSVAILLERLADDNQFARVSVDGKFVIAVDRYEISERFGKLDRRIFVRPYPGQGRNLVYGFWLRNLCLPGYLDTHADKPLIWSQSSRGPSGNGSGIFRIPNGHYGTAAVAYFPYRRADPESWRISWLKVGFDKDFNPMCIMGNKESMTNPYSDFSGLQRYAEEITKCSAELSRAAHDDIFLNKWLGYEEDFSVSLSRKHCHVVRGTHHSAQRWKIRNSNVLVGFEKVAHPSMRSQQQNQHIWAVDIEDRDRVPMRRYRGSVPSRIGHGTLVVGAASAGIYFLGEALKGASV